MNRITLLFLVALLIFLFSCHPDEPGEEIVYTFSIKASPRNVDVMDTVWVVVDWENSPVSNEFTVKMDGNPVVNLTITGETTFYFLVPDNVSEGHIRVFHPNEAMAEDWLIKDNEPWVKGFDKTNGKAGDLITMRGMEFLNNDSIGIRINTLPCEIVKRSDSVITFKVPDGCGNGWIKIVYWDGNLGSCTPQKIVRKELFTYNFTPKPKNRVVVGYQSEINVFTLERDVEGRVSKRINANNTDYYDTFFYDEQGMIDTIKSMYLSELKSYKVYARNSDNTQIEISIYDKNDKLTDIQESYFSDGKLVQKNYFTDNNLGYYQTFNNQYTYDGYEGELLRTFYTVDGEVDWQWHFIYEYDIYNSGVPDMGIPGFENFYRTYPTVDLNGSYNRLVYTEYGELESWESYDKCKLDYVVLKFQYE